MLGVFDGRRLAVRDGENVRRCGLISLSGTIGLAEFPTLPGFPDNGPCGCTVMRVSISSVFAAPVAGAEPLPAGNKSGVCAAELVVFASPDGFGNSSATALVANAAAKTSIDDKPTISVSSGLMIMMRSLSRLPLLRAADLIFMTDEHDLDCRYDDQEDDRTN